MKIKDFNNETIISNKIVVDKLIYIFPMIIDSFVVLSAQLLKIAARPHTPLGSLDLLPQL